MKKYLFFANHYYPNNKVLFLNGSLMQVKNPWDMIDNCFLRALCRFHNSPRLNSRLRLPFRHIWFRSFFCDFYKDSDEQVFIINGHFYQLAFSGLIEYFKKKYPNGKTVFTFSDKYEMFTCLYKHFPSVELIKQKFDLVLTYNWNDASKYNLTLSRPCFIDFSLFNPVAADDSDVFFVGRSKGRTSLLIDIYNQCVAHGLKCLFYILGTSDQTLSHYPGIFFNTVVPYNKVVSCVRKTKAIVNLVQNDGVGITLRDYEASFFGKVLITNNDALKDDSVRDSLFDDNQIIWIDSLPSKLDKITNSSFDNRKSDNYSIDNWYKWLDSLLHF